MVEYLTCIYIDFVLNVLYVDFCIVHLLWRCKCLFVSHTNKVFFIKLELNRVVDCAGSDLS